MHAPLKFKKCPFLLEEIPVGLSLFPKSQLHSIFSCKNGHFFNINGACKVIDVDTRHEDEIKTWKTSANNRSFFIYQEPTAKYFLKLKYVQLGLWKLRKTYYKHLFSMFLSQLHVFVLTSIALHAPLILKKCQFLLEKILCNLLLGNRESLIISTCFQCFYHNFTSKIDINSFV